MPYNVVLQFLNEKTAMRGTGGADWFRISKVPELECVRGWLILLSWSWSAYANIVAYDLIDGRHRLVSRNRSSPLVRLHSLPLTSFDRDLEIMLSARYGGYG